MKIVVFGPDRRTGVLRDGTVVDISRAFAKYLAEKQGEPHPIALAEAQVPSDLARLIEGGPRALERADTALEYLVREAQDQRDPRGAPVVCPAADTRLHAPHPKGGRIACAGGNFADHAAAMAEKMRGRPYEGDAHAQVRTAGIWGFWKVGHEVLGPDGDIVYPARADRLDYEGELAIVLGKRGVDIKAGDVRSYVWGITLFGDWSIRSPREPSGGPYSFVMHKNFDGSCSLGPCVAVGEADPFDVEVETLVNGERRQRYSTRDMVFSFGEYLEYLSRDLTFHPGDIISGGTAAGTAADSSPLLADGSSAPERYLKPGDAVEIRSPAVGSLRARVVAKGRRG
jgi:2-keto-4-pentenoate hydratase/2-oxohepta-3-ene-1,7-dioic acid hydratase in catechol pathway